MGKSNLNETISRFSKGLNTKVVVVIAVVVAVVVDVVVVIVVTVIIVLIIFIVVVVCCLLFTIYCCCFSIMFRFINNKNDSYLFNCCYYCIILPLYLTNYFCCSFC